MQSQHRLHTAEEFRLLFSRGMFVDTPFFRLVWKKSSGLVCRFAFVASRGVSKRAVVRNLLRRRTREWYRRRMNLFRVPIDLAVIFKREVVEVSRRVLYEELERATKKILERI